ncbi:MAG: Alkaline phosphatase synthesis transcriptional regulatory protein PhoP [Dehalococcoidia bacterium]|nr:Alkaline phosphatase synthesis transcriptional regulatory protein PhoP [Bacillota bacterium]
MGEKQARILLVDDDHDFVSATRMVLESKYEVIVAYDGGEGLRKAREEAPDLIILDVMMPGKDGFTAAEQLKKDSQLSKIPLMMLTGYSPSYSQRQGYPNIPASRGLTLEAEDYIQKPVKPEELLRRVEDLLAKV